MTEDDEREIRSLEFRLSRALDDCRRAQAALSTARRRLGLYDPRRFYTAAEMDDERATARIELREITAAVIADCRHRYDSSYKPDRFHAAMIQLAASFREGPRSNVVPLRTGQTAQQIVTADKKRK
jgi:hypothetical protein